MIHLTLQSYYDNNPVDPDDDQHPDGLLWPLTRKELYSLPRGTVVENIDTGHTVRIEEWYNTPVEDNGISLNSKYGLRGRREEEMV